MKYILTIVLLYTHQFASADVSLVFKDVHIKNSSHTTAYLIKENQLKLAESGSRRINIFDQNSQQFISFDPNSGKSSMINEKVLDQRVAEFNQRRLKQIGEVEKKMQATLKTMTDKEQEVGQSLLGMLKYPELYGKHTQLRVVPAPVNASGVKDQKLATSVACKSYHLYRKEQLLKTFCMAEASSLNMTAQEYQTLRGFYAFDYNMQTRLMLAAGQSDFNLVDYQKESIPGIAIEIISYKGPDIIQHLLLSTYNDSKLTNSVFMLKKGVKK